MPQVVQTLKSLRSVGLLVGSLSSRSTTAMIVLFWSRATRDLLKSFGWGIAALHRLDAATKLPCPRRPPHSICRSLAKRIGLYGGTGSAAAAKRAVSRGSSILRGTEVSK